MTRRLILFLFFSVFLTPACQDYNYEELRGSVNKNVWWSKSIPASVAADILFVMDNSGSMAGEQRQIAESFKLFTAVVDEEFGSDYHIAIISTGMESQGCPRCGGGIEGSCMNVTGENGRFQDRVCRNVGTDSDPEYVCGDPEPGCRFVNNDNLECFYDPAAGEGTVFTGVNGCGYERGLAPLRNALGALESSYNGGFLRDDAMLAVIVISDEEDCGEVGDVDEFTSDMGKICYYAAKGVGPDGETVHPEDPQQRSYSLTPVEEYYDFLVNDVKRGRKELVKFAAIVGVKDVDDLSTTTIEYQQDSRGRWDIVPACSTPGCTGDYCEADPGTRYIKLAEKFGDNGFVDTICQSSFDDTMGGITDLIKCPRVFKLREKPLDPSLAGILVNDSEVPRYSCSIEGQEIPCDIRDDQCPAGSECVRTWIYCPKDDPNPNPNCQCYPGEELPFPDCRPLDFTNADGGVMVFADHYDPCEVVEEGMINIEFVYVIP